MMPAVSDVGMMIDTIGDGDESMNKGDRIIQEVVGLV